VSTREYQLFGGKRKKQLDAYSRRVEAARQDELDILRTYIGDDVSGFLGRMAERLPYAMLPYHENETLHLAATVIRYALEGKDFEDMSDDLSRGKISDPYNAADKDFGVFLRGKSLKFSELVGVCEMVADAAGIENFFDEAMLANVDWFGDEKIRHWLFGWTQPSDYQTERLDRVLGERVSRPVRFVERDR
jgi:hypothetical protein